MQITKATRKFLYFFSLLLVLQNVACEESATATTATAVTAATATTATTTTTTTPKPKIHIADSALCKKCLCDTDDHLLDCSNGKLKNWFTTEEWEMLQNGDFTFETFKLQNNSLKEVPAFPAYPLKHLHLSHNEIEKIADEAFKNLIELSLLDLSHNKLTSKALKPDVFKGTYSTGNILPLAKMKELDLSHNLLHNLDDDLFEHLPNLETLILNKNVFQVIDHLTETAIAGLTSLKTLDLSYMELKELPEYFLHGPRELETLILTGNLLDELPDNLESSVNLKELVLDENLITEISGDNAFPAMLSLRYLSLSYMPEFTRVANEGFSKLQNLTHLIMTNNPKLHTIEERAFKKNTTNPTIFDYTPLEELHLKNNNLTILESNLFERWDKIKTIDLRFNPWSCDASNDYLIKVLMVQIKQTTPLLAEDVTCESPAELKSLPVNDARVKDAINKTNGNTAGVAIACVLVALLIGIPLIIGTVVMYRKGCFGLLYRRSMPAGAHYSRAGSAEDLHI